MQNCRAIAEYYTWVLEFDSSMIYLIENSPFKIPVIGGYVQEIKNVRITTLNQNTVSISWELKVPLIENSTETFYIYYGTHNTNILAGYTNNQSYILRNLTTEVYYRIYIAMTYAFSNTTYTTQVYQFKIENIPTAETKGLNVAGIAAITIVVFCAVLGIGILMILLAMYGLKRAGITGKFVREWLTLKANTKRNHVDTYMITSSECESGNVTLNNSSIRNETRTNPISVEETDIVIEQGVDIDSIYFANISQNDCNMDDNEITINAAESEAKFESDIPDVLSTEIADNKAGISPDHLSEDISDKTYTIPPTLSSDLNQTYEITPKDVEMIDTNPMDELQPQNKENVSKIELEFELLKAETDNNNSEFDVNNITLESPHFEDYTVNASYIYGTNFIATIHPTRRRNLLQLVYQNKCSLIVMLTSKMEQQSIIARTSDYVRYWPVDGDSTEQTETLIEQEISLQHSLDNNSISFKHIIFSGWNDNGDIEDINNVVELLRMIQTHKLMNPNSPVIIHCKDGITKTGVLMTCYTALHNMEANNCYNISDIVRDLRMQRTNMIPTLISYKACHRIMEEFSSESSLQQ